MYIVRVSIWADHNYENNTDDADANVLCDSGTRRLWVRTVTNDAITLKGHEKDDSLWYFFFFSMFSLESTPRGRRIRKRVNKKNVFGT